MRSRLASSLLAPFLTLPVGAHAADPAMVVTAQHLATDVGRDILARGGNAIDAAVAVGYALAVVDPCCGNIGGGGFMVIHLADGRDRFVDFREKAPIAATAGMFQDEVGNAVDDRSRYGWLAVGVPGTVAGLEHARAAYGTMSRPDLLAPAIRLAADGFTLGPGDIFELDQLTDRFAREPEVAKTFLKDGKPFAVGDRLTQPDLAASLRAIAAGGTSAFYRGPISRAVVAASKAHGGILTDDDFDRYIIADTDPVRCTYRGLTVVSAPPPSSGGTVLCETLNVLSAYPLGEWGFHSERAVHVTVEALRHAYADRNQFLGDPEMVQNPTIALLSDDYATRIRDSIDPARATPSSAVKPFLGQTPPPDPKKEEDTTHYVVTDRFGNAVSVTYTINLLFGASIIAEGTGFFLNDEMDDFTAKPGTPNAFGLVQGETNAVAPYKRPLSSMTPTILLDGGKPVMVVGAPGGSRIPTEVMGVIQNVLDYRMSLADAVAAPRIHHQYLPDAVMIEPGALDAGVRAALEGNGYAFKEQKPWGLAEAIAIAPDGTPTGASDPRRAGGSVAVP